MNKKIKTKELTLNCPICGEVMHEFKYGYDNHVNGEIYFKCDCCGHKESKII